MSYRLTAAAIAAAALCSPAVQAQDKSDSMFSFAGFGTIGVAHASEKQADFVGNILQPNGTGRTSDWDFNPDSRLAGQVTAKFTKDLTGVVQVVAQHRYDNSHTPALEWANLKYQLTPELSVRGGRIALPTFLVSESRFVGYAQPWVRPPAEVYFLGSITSNDGVDATYRRQIGGVNHAIQAFYGGSKVKLPNNAEAKSSPSWGLNDTMEFGDTTFRVGYVRNKLSLRSAQLGGLFGPLDLLGMMAPGSAAAEDAAALSSKYSLEDMKTQTLSLGVNHDAGNWFFMGEYAFFKGDGLITDSKSLYGTLGVRINKFTPYVTYAQTKPDIEREAPIRTTGLSGIPLAIANGLNAADAFNVTLNQINADQKTRSIGTRWDFMKNTALKLQYDHVSLGANSKGRLANVDPTRPNGGKFEVFSVAVDVVF
jgi:hypothetical protein